MCFQPGSVGDIAAASRLIIRDCSNEGQLSSNACIEDRCEVERVDAMFQFIVMGTATLGLLGVFSVDPGTLLLL